MIPVTPDELEALIPESDASPCDVIRLYNLWSFRVWQIIKYMRDSDGEMTVEFIDDICAAVNRAPS